GITITTGIGITKQNREVDYPPIHSLVRISVRCARLSREANVVGVIDQRAGARRPSCSPKTRRCGPRRISRSFQTCYAKSPQGPLKHETAALVRGTVKCAKSF